mmetsp:Transcript_17447/g.17542  ORF Transcript_17447/g.17542 Transcript_17447/m.17542 type:complete len:94 (+) Transcript_17447:42-323(+)
MAFVSGVTVTGSSVRGASVSNSVRRPASCRRETRVNMAMEAPVMDVMIRSSEVLNTAILIASKETDFGGYLGPAIGLLSIGAIIVALSPPLKD